MRITLIGPFPPPVHGQSVVTQQFCQAMSDAGVRVRVVDTSEGVSSSKFVRFARKLFQNAKGVLYAFGSPGPVYVSLGAGQGMWLTSTIVGAARLRGQMILIHHHSYDHVRTRRVRMVILAKISGTDAIHIMLSGGMASMLKSHTPEVRRTVLLNNAGLVSEDLLHVPLRSKSEEVVLGHLSNLSSEKGIEEAVRLGEIAIRRGLAKQFVLAGPICDESAQLIVDGARSKLGENFCYMGAVDDSAKQQFFKSITHFVFASRYKNEAAPLVILEALAAGVVCLAVDRGCVSEQLYDSPGVVIPSNADFADIALAHIGRISDLEDVSRLSREAFCRMRQEYKWQLAQVVDFVRSYGMHR